MVLDDKTKQKHIIKTYLIIKKEASAKELADFLNTHFKFLGKGVTAHQISRLFPTNNQKDILSPVKKIKKTKGKHEPIKYRWGET